MELHYKLYPTTHLNSYPAFLLPNILITFHLVKADSDEAPNVCQHVVFILTVWTVRSADMRWSAFARGANVALDVVIRIFATRWCMLDASSESLFI